MRQADRDQRQAQRRRAELDLVTAAAAWLRHRAQVESPGAARGPEAAEAVADTLDALAAHWPALPAPVRDAAISAGWQMLGERTREVRRNRHADQAPPPGPRPDVESLAGPVVGQPALRPPG